MPTNEELRRRQEQLEKERLEQRKQIEELQRINEQRERDRERIEKGQQGRPLDDRPTKDE